jgi:hypothetical protein
VAWDLGEVECWVKVAYGKAKVLRLSEERWPLGFGLWLVEDGF